MDPDSIKMDQRVTTLQKLARYNLQWKNPEKLIERNYSLEMSLKNNIQVERALCSQTFSLKLLDMNKRKWEVLHLSPVSDTVHVAEMMWFSVPPPMLQLHSHEHHKVLPTFLQLHTESLVPRGS